MDRFVARVAAPWLAVPVLIALAPVWWPRLHGWILARHDTRHAVTVPPAVTAAAPHAPTLGSHALLAQEDGHARDPAVTPAVDTAVDGSSYVVFNGGPVVNARPPIDNMGNAWAPLGAPVVYHGYGGGFDVKAYAALAGRGGPGHVVSLHKDSPPTAEATLLFVEIRHAALLADVAQTYAAAGPQAASGTVTTTGPALLLAVWWGDGFLLRQSAVPGDGFRIFENFVDLPPDSAVQCVAAYRRVDAAGTWRVTWQQAPQQGAILWLLAFQAAPG